MSLKHWFDFDPKWIIPAIVIGGSVGLGASYNHGVERLEQQAQAQAEKIKAAVGVGEIIAGAKFVEEDCGLEVPRFTLESAVIAQELLSDKAAWAAYIAARDKELAWLRSLTDAGACVTYRRAVTVAITTINDGVAGRIAGK